MPRETVSKVEYYHRNKRNGHAQIRIRPMYMPSPPEETETRPKMIADAKRIWPAILPQPVFLAR